MNKDLVNKRNTREWVKMNDNSKSHLNRDRFIKEHGGAFEREGKEWVWYEHSVLAGPKVEVPTIVPEPVTDTRLRQARKEFVFINKDGIEFLTDNFTKFCRKNDLNKSAMYKVMNGDRNHHKGFTCKKLPEAPYEVIPQEGE